MMSDRNLEEALCKKSGCSGHVRPIAAQDSQAAISAFKSANSGKAPAFICGACHSLYGEDQYLSLALEDIEGRIKPASE